MSQEANKNQEKKELQELESEEMSLEEALSRLEEVVEKLEQEDIPLEEAIELFQEGMRLSKLSGDKLDRVEQKVNMLIEEEGKLVTRPFEIKEDDA
ncbi:MAG: exodeoxyribonuclease VII small subunit [Bacillaceae bacterium]|nr:exodeoxyribonuclease VII small subunit [Bacillaceae bacterium]